MSNPTYGSIFGKIEQQEAIAVIKRIQEECDESISVVYKDGRISVKAMESSPEQVDEARRILCEALDELHSNTALSYIFSDDYGQSYGVVSRKGEIEFDIDEALERLRQETENGLAAFSAPAP